MKTGNKGVILVDSKKKNILVIDDEEAICEFYSFVLEDMGMEVTTVTDSEKASQLLRKYTYDIIISDMRMPKYSGQDLINQCLKEDLNLNAYWILVSGSLDSKIKDLAKEIGASLFMSKPINVDDIEGAVLSCISGKLNRLSDSVRVES